MQYHYYIRFFLSFYFLYLLSMSPPHQKRSSWAFPSNNQIVFVEKFKVLNEISPNRFGPLFHKLVIQYLLILKIPQKGSFWAKSGGLSKKGQKTGLLTLSGALFKKGAALTKLKCSKKMQKVKSMEIWWLEAAQLVWKLKKVHLLT